MRAVRRDAVGALGLAALGFSALYFASDAIEGLQGGFSTWQLWLTLVAEAAIPFVVIGLAAIQRPRISRLGEISAAAYAVSFVYFTWTVVYALINSTPDYDTLSDDLGATMTAFGALMLFAGLGFGYAVIRAGVLPRWTGLALMFGVVLVVATQGAPEGVHLVAAGVRDLAFAGMGLALLGPGLRGADPLSRSPRGEGPRPGS